MAIRKYFLLMIPIDSDRQQVVPMWYMVRIIIILLSPVRIKLPGKREKRRRRNNNIDVRSRVDLDKKKIEKI